MSNTGVRDVVERLDHACLRLVAMVTREKNVSCDDERLNEFTEDRGAATDTINLCINAGKIKQIGNSDADNYSLVPGYWPMSSWTEANLVDENRKLRAELERLRSQPSPTKLPTCVITGLIAGDSDACGDCDPCSASHAVPGPVKDLLRQKDEWREKYSDAMCKLDEAQPPLSDEELVEAASCTIREKTRLPDGDWFIPSSFAECNALEREIARAVLSSPALLSHIERKVEEGRAQERSLLEEIDGEIDRQLYDEEYVQSSRDNGLDIPKDAEHCITITESLRRRISEAIRSLGPSPTYGGWEPISVELMQRVWRHLYYDDQEAGGTFQHTLDEVVDWLAKHNALDAADAATPSLKTEGE